MSGRLRARVQEPVGQPVQQAGRRGRALDELQLPLPPLLLVVLTGRRGHLVVTELGDRGARGAVEQVDGAVGRDPGHRRQWPVANDGQHDVPQSLRDRPAVTVVQRRSHLGAGVRARGQLQVPAGVRSAGASAQRDVVSGQIVARGVEVDGVELLRRRPLHPGHRREALERRRNGRFDHVELPLDLRVPGRTSACWQPSPPSLCSLTGQLRVPYPGERPNRPPKIKSRCDRIRDHHARAVRPHRANHAEPARCRKRHERHHDSRVGRCRQAL